MLAVRPAAKLQSTLTRGLVMKHSLLAVVTLFLSMSAVAAPLGGKALYQQNCASCHGQKGQGGSAPKLAGDASKWRAKLFERAVLKGLDDNGKPLQAPMPHWEGASFKTDKGAAPSKAEVHAIQRYLQTLK